MARWKLTIEYDGTGFSGWQRQEEGVPSVQQAIEDAFFGFCQKRLTLIVAGRTDAGVHARGQVAHVDLDYGNRPLSGDDLAKALNAHLRPKAVAILSAEVVPTEFHARFSATNKLYTYRILNRSAPAALDDKRIWHIKRPLDVAAMSEGAKHLLGFHDFSTFRDSDCQAKSPERTLDRLDIETREYDEHGAREVMIHAEARSFLHHMVRNITGTLALVGDGKWPPQQVKEALAARDRTKGGSTAPADGLYLMRVDYGTK
jgi:tRNA pseudouridine38-40 synthase